jgi:hypothetical protein
MAAQIAITEDSTVQVSAVINYRGIKLLEQICITGVPEKIPEEMVAPLQSLVCQCINPYRYF